MAQSDLRRVDVVPCTSIDGVYSYRHAESSSCCYPVHVGSRVLVELRKRRVVAIVTSVDSTTEDDARAFKPILDVFDPLPCFHEAFVDLLVWAAAYYHCPIGSVFRSALPAQLLKADGAAFSLRPATKKAFKKGGVAYEAVVDTLRSQIGDGEAARFKDEELRRFLKKVAACRSISVSELREEFSNVTLRWLDVLERKQIGRLSGRMTWPAMPVGEGARKTVTLSPFELTEEQLGALAAIRKEYANPKKAPVLIHGVTGSGKTEIYMRAIEEVIAGGKQAIVMVPEIALTPQLIGRFRERFGALVGVAHSALGDRERTESFLKAASGGLSIMIGARSVVFAPFKNLGIIVVDEEHDGSYKQSDAFLYNSKHLALMRAKKEGAVLVLGSATPSLESYRSAALGRYRLVELTRRPTRQALPLVDVIDMTKETRYEFGAPKTLSEKLDEAITRALQARQQVILFLNRRGYAPIVLCNKCHNISTCRNCHVSLTYHDDWDACVCHHCNYRIPLGAVCSVCEGGEYELLGLGTKKILSEVSVQYPDARVGRFDRDTTISMKHYEAILRDFQNREIDILVGTQMITKGLDFPNVTVVGVMMADLGLNLPDFRAAEKTFQLLSQVSGRAGRGDDPGRVYIQTYNPNHYSILMAKAHNFRGFYEHEIRFREELHFPPFSRLVHICFSGLDRSVIQRSAEEMAKKLRQVTAHNRDGLGDVDILGPAPAPIERIKGKYRWRILIRSPNERFQEINRFLYESVSTSSVPRKIDVRWDVDPVHFL